MNFYSLHFLLFLLYTYGAMCFLTASLLIKKQAWGYALSSVLLLKILTMGAALIAMIVSMILGGVELNPGMSVIFVIICLPGIILGMVTLKTIRD